MSATAGDALRRGAPAGDVLRADAPAGDVLRGATVSGDERARILIVDDRTDNLLALEAILEPLGQEIVRASSGEDALRAALTTDFAVILLDVQMPGMNGFETAALLKRRARTRHTPLIFLTAISKEERFVFEGYSVGAVDYMPKPLQPDILRSKVGVFVELWAKTREIQRQAELLRESEKREIELRHASQLRESEARAAQIVDSAMEAIVTFDADRRITVFNAAAEGMFGIDAPTVNEFRLEHLFHPRARAKIVARVARLAADVSDRTSPPETLPGLRADGRDFPFEVSLSRLDLADGPVFTLIGRDITDRVRAQEALRRQAWELEEAAGELRTVNEELQRRQCELERAMSARSRFYASMSHELRTPINAILGYSELLLDRIYGDLNEQQLQGIERTRRAGRHLLELVNDVLDLSKIEAGKLELQFEPVSFPAMLEDLFVTVRPIADRRGSALELRQEGEERTIVTDPRRVRQILLNLVSNALKFGSGNPVEVVYAPVGDDAVEITVADHGPGISEEDLPRIFEEFVQLSAATAVEGTGLGLPISRRLATLLGGEIAVTSTPGEGSRFTLRVPTASDTVMNAGAEASPDTLASSPAARRPEPVPAIVEENGADGVAGDGNGALPGRVLRLAPAEAPAVTAPPEAALPAAPDAPAAPAA